MADDGELLKRHVAVNFGLWFGVVLLHAEMYTMLLGVGQFVAYVATIANGAYLAVVSGRILWQVPAVRTFAYTVEDVWYESVDRFYDAWYQITDR